MFDLTDPDLVVADGTHSGDLTLDQLATPLARPAPDPPRVDERDAVAIFPTSGTTGTPKRAVLSHRAVRLRLMTYGTNSGPTSTIFPPFHWGGWGAYQAALAGLNPGGHGRRWRHRGDPRHPGLRRVTRFYAIPAVWRRILRADPGRYDLGVLREANTGTSATPPDLLRQIAEALPGTTTSIGYGSTESGASAPSGPPTWPANPARSGCRRPACGPASTTTASSGSAARSCSPATGATPRPPPRSCATAGTAPATWSSATARATCRWWGGPGT